RQNSERLCGTPCRTEHRSESQAISSLCRATLSVTSERLPELLGSSPIPLSSSLLAFASNSGPFPPPALPGFIGTTDLPATPHGPAWLSRVASRSKLRIPPGAPRVASGPTFHTT